MSQTVKAAGSESFVKGLWGVRYQVKDVARSVKFYSEQLGLKLDQQHLPAFAQVSGPNFKLILSGPGASGSRPMPNGERQEPGGWNRVILQVDDLPARIETLKQTGLSFRTRWKWDRVESKFGWKIPTAIRSNCLSRRTSVGGHHRKGISPYITFNPLN